MMNSALKALRGTKRLLQRRAATGWPGRVRGRMLRRGEGQLLLLERFARDYGYQLDLVNPKTFTEKLFCRMVRWNRRMDPKFTRLTDKLAVRPYVADKIGQQHLVELLWHGRNPKRIPFDRLPRNYVVKPNHGSGSIIAVKGNADPAEIVRRASSWLETNLYWVCRENQYFRIPPRLMVEEYLANPDGSEVFVYKFWCFDGVPHVASVGDMARTMNPYYDMAWNQLELQPKPVPFPQPPMTKPRNFDQMIALASRLSQEFDFVRVDLYNMNGRIYFGELTFTPAAGWFRFKPFEWDVKLGQLWTLRD